MATGRVGTLVMIAVATALTGCGSTVEHREVWAQGGGDGLGGTPSNIDAAAPGGGISVEPAPTTTRDDPSRAIASTRPVGDAVAGPSQASSSVAVTTGRGFTGSSIRIGYGTADDAESFTKTFPIQGLDAGDPKAQLRIVVDDLNRRGGIFGRKIEMVAHDFQSAQLVSNPSAANQAACATWTQDTRVHAVVLPGLVTDNLLHCLDKARTPLVQSGAEIFRQYASTYKRYPRYFHTSAMEGDRFDRLAIQRLLARGYFTPWDRLTGRPGGTAPVRVGVVIRNDDDYDSQLASLKRSFAAAGITPFSYDRCPATINTSSCMQNLELRYQANNVTHVYGQFDTIFMNTANSQGYRPRYFVPIELNLFAQNAPGDQLVGAMAESYLPTSDVPDQKDPGGPTDATTRCLALMKKGGQIPRTRLARASMASICDSFWFIEAAIKRHGSLTDDALEHGLQQLGTSVHSALTWATRLGPDQHAGTFGLRDLAYEEACRCFSYVSSATYTG